MVTPDLMKNFNLPMPMRTIISSVVLLVCVIGLTGCLARTPLKQQTFAFGSPEVAASNSIAAAAGSHVLAIRKLQIAAPFDSRALVYRTGEFTYVNDPYAAFLQSPGDSLLAPIRNGLCQHGDFSTVVGTSSALKADTMVEIYVSRLYGDFQQPKKAEAILTMQFIFFDATNGIATKPLLQKEYSRNIALGKPTAAALVKGWNQALGEILTDAATDYRQAKSAE